MRIDFKVHLERFSLFFSNPDKEVAESPNDSLR
jgi:hypothetical protein